MIVAFTMSLIASFAAVTFLWRQATVRQEETMRLLEMTLASSDEGDRRAETMLKQAKGTLEFRQKQLEESVRFMDEVLVTFPENEDVIRQSLVSYFRLAKVQEMREQFSDSTHSFQMAALRAEQLLRKNPDSVEVKFDLFHCWLGLYSVDRGPEQEQINRSYLTSAMHLISEISFQEPDNADYQDALACTAILHSMYDHASGRFEDSMKLAELAWKTAVDLKAKTPQPSQKWRHTGTAALGYTKIYLELGQLDSAQRWCEIAQTEVWEFVNRDNIDLPGELLDWSQVLMTRIEIDLLLGNHQSAREHYSDATSWIENCITRYPDHPYFQTELDSLNGSLDKKFPDFRK